MSWTKHKGPLRYAKREADVEASHDRGKENALKLGRTLQTWLFSQPNACAAFSGAGLGPFFESHPRERLAVETTPGILPAALKFNSTVELFKVRLLSQICLNHISRAFDSVQCL